MARFLICDLWLDSEVRYGFSRVVETHDLRFQLMHLYFGPFARCFRYETVTASLEPMFLLTRDTRQCRELWPSRICPVAASLSHLAAV